MGGIKKNKDQTKRILRLFLGLTFLFFIVLSISLSIVFHVVSRDVKKTITGNIKSTSYLLNEIVVGKIDIVKTDVTFLANQVQLFHFFEKSDFDRHLKETFYQYSSSKRMYDQLRYIDKNGMEKVRINFDGKEVSIVPDNMLQNKSGRYYFSDILSMGKDSVYFSVLDLNIEEGKLEIPYKPMIRAGAPVFDENNNKMGIVVVNYLAESIINDLKEESKQEKGNLLFVNSAGYYYIGLKAEDEWGFMFEDKEEKTFINDFPEESELIFNKDQGNFISQNGLFVFSTIKTQIKIKTSPDDSKSCSWKIISYVPRQLIKDDVMFTLRPWFRIIIIFSLGVLVLFWFLARNIEFKQHARKELYLRNEELKESNITKDKFFSIIAHDLRAPFHSLLGLTDLLYKYLDDYSKEEIVSMAESIYKTSHNTYELLENLLSWSRMQTGKLVASPKPFSLKELLLRVKSLMDDSAKNKDIQFIFRLNEDMPFIFADYEMVNTVIRNLISNAIKFTPRGGELKVSCGLEADFVEIAVSDNGIGMNESTVQSLFSVGGVKSQSGTEDEPGTGLGLMLCKEFVEKNGGSIRVQSEPGKGSTFYISLPIAKET